MPREKSKQVNMRIPMSDYERINQIAIMLTIKTGGIVPIINIIRSLLNVSLNTLESRTTDEIFELLIDRK